jgi:hypothetical protein
METRNFKNKKFMKQFFLPKEASTLAIRNWHHILFNYVPSLKPSSETIFNPFLEWAYENNLTMNWALHIHLMTWLSQSQFSLDEKIIKELLIASAIRWGMSGYDHINVPAMMIASPQFPEKAIAFRKNTAASQTTHVAILKLPEAIFPSQNAFALADKDGNWGKIEWLNIPK